jgi:hypothetical protein
MVLWDVTPCSLVDGYQYCREPVASIFQTDKMKESSKNGRNWTRDMSDYGGTSRHKMLPKFCMYLTLSSSSSASGVMICLRRQFVTKCLRRFTSNLLAQGWYNITTAPCCNQSETSGTFHFIIFSWNVNWKKVNRKSYHHGSMVFCDVRTSYLT